MRTTLAITFCAALAFMAAPLAAAPVVDSASLFKGLDANADGQATLEEAGDAHALLFRRLLRTGDDDGDGQLTQNEFAAALEPVRAAKAVVEKQGSRLPGADALLVVLAKMDADGDRRLEAEEIPEGYQAVFQQMLGPADANKDGRLDAREIARGGPRLSIMATRAAMQKRIDVAAELAKLPPEQLASMEQMGGYGRPGPMMADPQQAEAMFARLDANGDDRLSADEAPGPLADRFEQMLARGDRDGDKQLSKNEFLQSARRLAEFQGNRPDPATSRRMVRQLLDRFDADGDSALGVKEVPRRVAENFDRIDADANGRLEGGELNQLAANMNRARRRGGRPPSPEASPADSGADEPSRPRRVRQSP